MYIGICERSMDCKSDNGNIQRSIFPGDIFCIQPNNREMWTSSRCMDRSISCVNWKLAEIAH